MKELAQFQVRIQRELTAFFRCKRREVALIHTALLPLFDRAAEFTLRKGSKRIRGFMFLQGYTLLHEKVPNDIFRLAMIPELMHAYLLIEDDVFDRDVLRRGAKTLHAAIADAHPGWPGGADHYGMSQGILLAGLIGIWSRQIILESTLAAKKKLNLLRRVEKMLEDTHYGEMLDILMSGTDHVTERDVHLVYVLKTARYTFVAPLQMGAAVAGATTRQLTALEQFGIPLGIAFQIQDDYLGVFGTEQQIGKSVMSDLEEKKKTLLVLHTQQRLKGKERAQFRRLLAKPHITNRDAALMRALMQKSGASQSCQVSATEMAEEAKHVLTKRHGFAIHTVEHLRVLADFMIHRNR